MSPQLLRSPILTATRTLASKTRGLLSRNGKQPQVVSALEAVSVIPPTSRVYVHGVSSVPTDLLSALAERAKSPSSDLQSIEFCHLHLEGVNPCMTGDLTNVFRTNNFFIGANERSNVKAGKSSYIPVFLSDVPRLMRHGLVTPDVSLLNVSVPDKHGFCSLGTEVATSLPAAETSKTIIAQINPNVPRTHGDSFIHISCLDYIVESDTPLPTTSEAPLRDVDLAIGRHIASLVRDGSTLQMGIGNIPNAILGCLNNHKDLGIHTEMFQEGVIPLVQSGVVNNTKKKYLPGKIVTSFVMGSQRLYGTAHSSILIIVEILSVISHYFYFTCFSIDFVNDNPEVYFQDASIVSVSIVFLSSINSKTTDSSPFVVFRRIIPDITGQVCADSIGKAMISGVGGQVDFERGAAISRGGVPIIAIPSTTKNGESRIVSALKTGAGVVTTRSHIHYVVTEYGVAYLFGKNLQQRAKALIDIAHPDHREHLEKDCFDRFGIQSWLF
ncbi:acetyl-CoA hydrolase/transferase family protein [Paraphysoderma sedebokerense]|nr:acetyl-CoA hydrolase/transferase family protein [Paraphysoderma sedebokerense]